MKAVSRLQLIRRSSAALRAEAGCRTAFVSDVIPVGDVSLGRWTIDAISPGEAWQADINRAKDLVYARLAAEYRLASE